MQTTNDFYRETLRNNICTVEFIKSDGETRVMRCTLNQQYLPERTQVRESINHSDDTISVWDLDKSAWRSFRIDSVKLFEVVTE